MKFLILLTISFNLLAGVSSSRNATNTLLTSLSSFTGDWEDVRKFSEARVFSLTDQNADLFVQFSPDGVNQDSSLTFKVTANINEVHRLVITRPYFRVKLTNTSASDQTFLRLGTILSDNSGMLTAPNNLVLGLDVDSLSVRGTIPEDEIVIGKRAGVRHFSQFSNRTGLTAANGEETIWGASSNFTPMTTASTFTITYTNATDGSTANGAKTLQFDYIDSSGLYQVANHTLGSNGSDETTFTGLGISRAVVISSGSTQFNGSAITITATIGGTTQAIIPIGASVTQQAIFFVDSNSNVIAKYLHIESSKTGGGASPKVTVKGYVFNRAIATRFLVYQGLIDTQSDVVINIHDPVGFKLSPTDVLYFVADTDTNGADINLRFSLIEYKQN